MSVVTSADGRPSGPARAARPVAQPQPTVAVLCPPERARAAACGVGLALARACGTPCALVAAIGAAHDASSSLVPAAHRAAARLRREGVRAGAAGRVVWLATAAVGVDDAAEPPDLAGAAAAGCASLRRAAAALRLPATVAIPFARTAAIDRVLRWHDAIVVVNDSAADAPLAQLVLASLAALDRPLVAMDAPTRFAAHVASAGLHAPAPAVAAVRELSLGSAAR